MNAKDRKIIERVLNLSKHPYFVAPVELPAWNEAISDLRCLYTDLEQEQMSEWERKARSFDGTVGE